MTDDDISLAEYIRAIRADWRLVGILTGAAAVLSIITTLALTEIFRAEAGIVESGSAGGGSAGSSAMLSQVGGIAGLAGIDIGALGGTTDNAAAILRSRMLVEEFVARNELLPVLFANNWNSGDRPTLWLGVRRFRDDVLTIREDVTTGVTYVTIDWTDSHTAAAWANGLVALTNEIVRDRDLERAERNIAFLKAELERTSVVEMQRVLYNLIESEMKTIMLANANPEYAFSMVDPAVAPEVRAFPHRALLVIIGTVLGAFVALVMVLVRLLVRRG